MKDFVSVLNVEPLLTRHGYNVKQQNIENIYADICETDPGSTLRSELESAIFSYFAELQLPDKPTLYDYLVLSLRPKDFIATFNWDPFLVQAVQRNGAHATPPQLLFLHGNVAVGHCMKCKCMGPYDWSCSKCGGHYDRCKLLYPIHQKNYASDSFILTQWRTIQDVLRAAPMVTIFGYGAPVSDVEAIKLLKEGWGTAKERNMEQIEIINRLSEDEIYHTWKSFIHSDHFQHRQDFFTSWIAKHPSIAVFQRPADFPFSLIGSTLASITERLLPSGSSSRGCSVTHLDLALQMRGPCRLAEPENLLYPPTAHSVKVVSLAGFQTLRSRPRNVLRIRFSLIRWSKNRMPCKVRTSGFRQGGFE